MEYKDGLKIRDVATETDFCIPPAYFPLNDFMLTGELPEQVKKSVEIKKRKERLEKYKPELD